MSHIALIMASFEAGGAERVDLRLVDGLLARGYRVDIVAVNAFGDLLPLVPAAVRIVDLRSRRIASSLPRLRRYFRDERPDVAIGVLDSMSVVALLALLLAGVRTKFVVQSHSSPTPTRAPKRYVLYALMRSLYRRADALVAAGPVELAGEIARYSGEPLGRFEVIPNGIIEDEFFRRLLEPAEWPASPEGEQTLIAVGRLHDVKNYPVLIDAVALLRARGVRCRLLIAGEGYERSRIELQRDALALRDAVTLLGFVPNPLPLIRRADLLVVASRAEGFPTVILEALGCGTPVVSTDCDFGPREILDGGRFGTLVAVNDSAALAHGIERALAAPRNRDELVERAREFTVERMVARYDDLLQRLLR